MHRNSQKRIYLEEGIYFVTSNTNNRYPYFEEEIFCEVFMENLEICRQLKHFELYAYCLLYDHAHLLLKPGRGYNVSKIIQFIKRHTTRDINYIINGGAIRESRLRGGDYEKFGQIIKTHDNKLLDWRNAFINKHGHSQSSYPMFKWQKSFHDHVIRNDRDFTNHFQYTAYNHLKHGLGEGWYYSSVNNPMYCDEPLAFFGCISIK